MAQQSYIHQFMHKNNEKKMNRQYTAMNMQHKSMRSQYKPEERQDKSMDN